MHVFLWFEMSRFLCKVGVFLHSCLSTALVSRPSPGLNTPSHAASPLNLLSCSLTSSSVWLHITPHCSSLSHLQLHLCPFYCPLEHFLPRFTSCFPTHSNTFLLASFIATAQAPSSFSLSTRLLISYFTLKPVPTTITLTI